MPSHNAAGGTSSTGGSTTITLSAFSAAAGSDRFLEVYCGIGTGSTPASPTSVTWGGVNCTQRGTGLSIHANAWMSKWYLKEADFPGGATGNVVATYAASHDEHALQAKVISDVNQSSPFRGASVTTNTGTNATPTITVSSDAADLVSGGAFDLDVSGEITSISVSAGTSRHEIETIAGGFECAGISDVAGSSPTLTWAVNGTDGTTAWGMMADSLQAPAGGGSKPFSGLINLQAVNRGGFF